ncbi:MAG: GGDEF domain-containing protein [Candidatus Muirbacterium halophilum]|nr:GGDEF domain-containing protein [Candidatus Muirbacterium halophilum]MCK9475261.1 GGDEF domain-containing protein [Candidatus Muirbacterium halophilum]
MIKKKCRNCDYLRFDPLTGLYRKEFFILMYSRRKMNKGKKFVLCVCDIDLFKNFNDKYGHIAGDFVLSKFSSEIIKNLKNGEFAGRFGGEEFVVILENSEIRIKEFFNSISDNCKENEFEGEILPEITFSMGVSYTDEFYSSFEKADQAMYFSKKNGRNKYSCFWNIKLNEKVQSKNILNIDNKKLLFGILALKDVKKNYYLYGSAFINRQYQNILDFVKNNFDNSEVFIYKNECICMTMIGVNREKANIIKKQLIEKYKDIYGVFNLYPGITEFKFIFNDTYDAFLTHDLYNQNKGIVFLGKRVVRITGEYFFKSGNFEKAYKIYRRSYFFEKKNQIAINNLASCMLKIGKEKSAVILLEKNNWANNHCEYFINLANCYYRIRDFEKCHSVLKNGIRIYPQNTILINNIKEIECLLNT